MDKKTPKEWQEKYKDGELIFDEHEGEMYCNRCRHFLATKVHYKGAFYCEECYVIIIDVAVANKKREEAGL